MAIDTIGVVGAGVMGAGIAQMFAEHGVTAVLYDVDADMLERGMGGIDKRLARSVDKGSLSEERAACARDHICKATSLADLERVGLVVEAIIEDLAIKRQLFAALGAIVGEQAILATNTSSLSVQDLAVGLTNPERFLGVHFFNPPTKLELVEVIPFEATGGDVTSEVRRLLEACGKTPVIVKDSPGFIVNRLLLLLINEAARMVDEGVATAEDIDAAMRLGALHPTGPLAVADLIGLDTCEKILGVLAVNIGESSYSVSTAIQRLVAAGKTGRKQGEGFFSY